MAQYATELLNRYPIISDQIKRPALEVVLGSLEHVLVTGVQGDIAEFGCYIGTTSLFIRRLLDNYDQSGQRTLYAYDSFEGLPAKTGSDASAAGRDFTAGELAVSKKQFLHQFQRAHLVPPVTHKAWFKDLRPGQLPTSLAFAFLDGDFYESIGDSLRLAWPRLVSGGIITIDDYKRETLPGVELAVSEWLPGKPVSLRYSHNIAVITKR